MYFPGEQRLKVTYKSIWSEFKVRQYSEDGFKIHTSIEIEGAMNKKCTMIVYFYYCDGTMVGYTKYPYATVDNKLCTYKEFTPPYPCTIYRDLELFIPNKVFERYGDYYYKVAVYCGDEWQHSTERTTFVVFKKDKTLIDVLKDIFW